MLRVPVMAVQIEVFLAGVCVLPDARPTGECAPPEARPMAPCVPPVGLAKDSAGDGFSLSEHVLQACACGFSWHVKAACDCGHAVGPGRRMSTCCCAEHVHFHGMSTYLHMSLHLATEFPWCEYTYRLNIDS